MIDSCDACLRRGYLVGLLAGRIAGLLDGSRRRPAGLLALDDAELAMAVGGKSAAEALDFLARFEPRRARADLARSGVGAVCRHAGSYPAALRDLSDPPAVVFLRGRRPVPAAGQLSDEEEAAVARLLDARREETRRT